MVLPQFFGYPFVVCFLPFPGKVIFMGHGGKVCFDIGWVGFDCAPQMVADGNEHQVELMNKDGRYYIIIDGTSKSRGNLQSRKDDPATVFGFAHPVGHNKNAVHGDMGVAFSGKVSNLKLVYADGEEGVSAAKAVDGYQ